jgi:hypothetical protein
MHKIINIDAVLTYIYPTDIILFGVLKYKQYIYTQIISTTINFMYVGTGKMNWIFSVTVHKFELQCLPIERKDNGFF